MTDPVPSKGWWSSPYGRFAQALAGALFIVVLRLQLDNYYA